MIKMNEDLKNYVETEIFPIYEENDAGHNLEHVRYVIRRSLNFARQFENIDFNMVYVIAAFHDVAHHIDKDMHEILSAKLFWEDEKMKQFFTLEQRRVMKEAIEDHRASLEGEPRNDYGKILSSADRNTDLLSCLKRTHAYTVRHYANSSLDEMLMNAYYHISKKYGENGYAKMYVKDEEYEKFLQDVKSLLEDKYTFAKKYMEVNGIIEVKELAKFFAIQAHKGQIRKGEPDKPMIFHPMGVGVLLEQYGFDSHVVAAGYLHDVVEDTKYTIEDIREEFGEDIAELVMGASEPDKSLSWEERKKHTIEEIKKLPLRSKAVICADKIHNLEDLMMNFIKSGKRDFSAFKRGEEKQRWYYTSVYESLILGEDTSLPIFQRLKNILDSVFYEKEDIFLRDIIFENSDYYRKLKKLHAQKQELQKLKALSPLLKPFVIEFTGTPRTGKTTAIHNLYDFFKKGGFKVVLIEEFTTSKYYKETLKKEFDEMNLEDGNIAIIDAVYQQLLASLKRDVDIILIDRSINDRQVWNYRRYVRGDMSEKRYQETREKYVALSKKFIDFLVITYADPLTCVRRDYRGSLALEERRFLNIGNVQEYNKSLKELQGLFSESVENSIMLDTTKTSMEDTTIKIANSVMVAMREKYIRGLEEKYGYLEEKKIWQMELFKLLYSLEVLEKNLK